MSRRKAAEGEGLHGDVLLYPIHAGPQQMFMETAAEEVLYGGAAGGGKSYALRAYLVDYCLRYPGAQVVLFRRTYKELEDTHILRIMQEIPKEVGHYSTQTHNLTFPNGSVFMFRYCAEEADVYSYDTAEFDTMGFDELTAFTEFQYLYLTSRCRSTKPWWPGRRIRSATNPGNVGHTWVKSRWIQSAPPFAIHTEPIGPGGGTVTRQFIPAKVQDNPTLMKSDPGYLAWLGGLPYEQYRAKALGDWDIFAGQYFTRWRDRVHVTEPFDIPIDWPRYICVDYGFAVPRAIYWAARPPGTTTLVLYREQYGAGMPIVEQARQAREVTIASCEKIQLVIMDPAMWAKTKDETGHAMRSHADIWREFFADLAPVVKGDNDRLSGASDFRQMLDWTGTEERVMIAPRLRVFSTCPNFIRTIKGLQCSPNNPEDVDTSGEDHAYDAVRYLIRAVVSTPQRPQVQYVETRRGIVSRNVRMRR